MHRSCNPSLSAFILRLGLFELLFLTPLIFYGWATTFSVVKESFAQMGCLLLWCGFCFHLSRHKLTTSTFSPVTFFIILFALLSLISFAWSASFYASCLGLGVWGTFFVVYFLTLELVKSERWMRILTVTVISSGFLAAGYSFFQFYGIELPIWREIQGRMRIFSTFGNPNYLAGYLVAALHLGSLLFFISRGKWKFLWLAVTGLLYISLLITYTRGAWASLFFSGLFVIILLFLYNREFFRKNKLSISLLLLLITTVTLVYSTPNPLNVKKGGSLERGLSVMSPESSASQRFLIWGCAVELIKEKPVLGWGVGTFGVHYPGAQGKFLSRMENKDYLPRANRSINAHNDYLHIWVEQGLVGLFLFLGIIGIFYWRLFSFLRKSEGKNPALFLIFFTGGITSFLIHAGVSFPFHIIQNGMVFYFLLALAVGIIQGGIKWEENIGKNSAGKTRYAKGLSPAPLILFLKWAILLLVVAGTVYLSFWRMKIFISDLHVKQAKLFMESRLYSPARKELEEAVKINPYNAQAFADLTRIYSYFGLHRDVIQAARRAELNWNVPDIHNRRAFAYLKMGKIEKARGALQRCIYLYPNFAAGYINSVYLNLVEVEDNIKKMNLKMAEKNLDKAFLYYAQASIWQPELFLPKRLPLAYYNYHRVKEKKQEKRANQWVAKKISPPFLFYSKKEHFIAILPPLTEPNREFNLNLLLYTRKDSFSPEKNQSFSLKVRLKEDGKLIWKKDFLDLEVIPGFPTILRFEVEQGVPSGEYMLFARFLSEDKVLSSAEVKFRCSPFNSHSVS